MNIGICSIRLHFPESQSLKDKRHTLKSIISRLRNQFNISVSEVDAQDKWQLAVIGIACVSNQNGHASDTLTQVTNFIQNNYPEVEIIHQETEIIPVSSDTL